MTSNIQIGKEVENPEIEVIPDSIPVPEKFPDVVPQETPVPQPVPEKEPVEK